MNFENDNFDDNDNSDNDNNSNIGSTEGDNGKALELKNSIGYNSAMTGAVHNLTLAGSKDSSKKEIFFPAAHTGVIYNYVTHESKLLQGHVS